jgi:hypothetical protein
MYSRFMALSPPPSRWVAWASLIGAIVLLLWPIAPDTPLWDMPGVFGGGRPGVESADVITPIGALISGESLGDGGDRLQLAGGLFLLGLAVGVGWRSDHQRRTQAVRDEAFVEPHGFYQP